jgi:hypothetical protein
MTGACHSAQLLVEMGSCELFAQVDLEPRSSWSSQEAGITGINQPLALSSCVFFALLKGFFLTNMQGFYSIIFDLKFSSEVVFLLFFCFYYDFCYFSTFSSELYMQILWAITMLAKREMNRGSLAGRVYNPWISLTQLCWSFQYGISSDWWVLVPMLRGKFPCKKSQFENQLILDGVRVSITHFNFVLLEFWIKDR